MVAAARTLLVFTALAGLSLYAGCTSGTTADCSPDAGGTPNLTAWCGVPAGDASEMPESGGPTETGAGDSGGIDSAPESGGPDAAPEAAPDGGEGGGSETGSPEAAADAPQG